MKTETLHSALEKHYSANPQFHRPSTYTPPLNEIMLIHDFVHVVYNVDTSLFGEALAENISYLKTDTKLSHHGRFWLSKHGRTILKNLIQERTLLVMVKILTYMVLTWPYVLFKCRHQTKRIPLYIYELHQDTPIATIREKFTIHTF